MKETNQQSQSKDTQQAIDEPKLVCCVAKGRTSELAKQVDSSDIVDRIMDTPITIKDSLAASYELSDKVRKLIKVKNEAKDVAFIHTSNIGAGDLSDVEDNDIGLVNNASEVVWKPHTSQNKSPLMTVGFNCGN